MSGTVHTATISREIQLPQAHLILPQLHAFYMEFHPGPEYATLIESISVLHDREILTSFNGTKFASQHSSLCVELSDDSEETRAHIYFCAPHTAARQRETLVDGWVIRFRLNKLPSPALTARAVQVLQDIDSEAWFSVKNAKTPDRLRSSLNKILRLLWAHIDQDLTSLTGIDLDEDRKFSVRTRRRRLKSAIGLTPKTHQSLRRFHRVLGDIANSSTRLTDLADDHEYADQAHLTREFRSKAGLPPGKFRRIWNSQANVVFFRDKELGPNIRFALAIGGG